MTSPSSTSRLNACIEAVQKDITASEDRLNARMDISEERLGAHIEAAEDRLNGRIDVVQKDITTVQEFLQKEIVAAQMRTVFMVTALLGSPMVLMRFLPFLISLDHLLFLKALLQFETCTKSAVANVHTVPWTSLGWIPTRCAKPVSWIRLISSALRCR